MTLRQDFADDFASTAFRDFAGDKAIVGKYGAITQLEDGSYDCWLVHPDGSPLSEQKLTAVEKKLSDSRELIRLDGEAYAQGQGRDFVLEMAAHAGVKRRKRMSAEAREKAAERMRAVRQGPS